MKRREGAQSAAVGPRPQAGRGDAVWTPRGAGFPARAIASLVPRITQKSFEKHGFAAASLIMDWSQIVGHALARDTRPLKLKWPRGVQTFAEAEEVESGRPGATLTVQVDPAVALDVQYRSEQLIDRINAYFGYRAVASLRLVQEPIEPLPNTRPPEAAVAGAADPVRTAAAAAGDAGTEKAATDEDPLASALARLGAHIQAQKGRSAGG